MPRKPPHEPHMGEWYADPSHVVRSGAILDGADYAIERFSAFDIPLGADDRLHTARALIRRVQEGTTRLDATDPSTLRLVAEANRTLYEQYLIARAVAPLGATPEDVYLKKITTMLLGAPVPEDDPDPEPRNTQFELYVLSLLRIGGKEAIIAEPDIRMNYDGVDVGIAAKRLTSHTQLGPQLKIAAGQIKGAGVRGFAAVNVDAFFEGLVLADQLQEKGEAAATRFASLRGYQVKYLQEPAVLGILGFGSVFGWDLAPRPPRLAQSNFMQLRGIPDDQAGEILFNKFFGDLRDEFERRLREL